jgi:hypothetical protein
LPSQHSRKRRDGAVLRRNPGRGDASSWKSRGFICTAAIEGYPLEDADGTEEYSIPEDFFPALQYSLAMFSIFDDARISTCRRQRKGKMHHSLKKH